MMLINKSSKNGTIRPVGLGLLVLALFGAILFELAAYVRKDVTTSSENALRENLFQRFKKEMGRLGNAGDKDPQYEKTMRQIFDDMVVHPTFGLVGTKFRRQQLRDRMRSLRFNHSFRRTDGIWKQTRTMLSTALLS